MFIETRFQSTRTWPTEGRIEFKNISFRYNKMDSPVLKQLNFAIKPGEKVKNYMEGLYR